MEDTKRTKQQQTESAQKKERTRTEHETNPFIDSMTLINKSYVYEFASETYCRDHGRTRKEVVGNSVAQIWGETSFKFIRKHLDQCFSGNVVRYENWLEFPGEEAKFYRVTYSPYFNQAGYVTHAVVASEDITDFKREEESLEKSDPGFRAVLKNMHYGVFTFDPEGRFTFVNDVIVKRSGYPREWYVGKSLFDVVRPQERDTVREHFQATVRGEQQVVPYEFSFLKAADEIAWAHISTTPIREGGQIVGVLGVMLDITKRVQSEHALIESEEKYRRLFEESRDAIFITDNEGRLTDVNRSFLKLFDYKNDEIDGLRAIDTYVNKDKCIKYMKEVEEEGFVEDFAVKLKKKDGTVMECLLNGTPLRGVDGKIRGYQGIARQQSR
jgi:PAS domain S-box-containing protein